MSSPAAIVALGLLLGPPPAVALLTGGGPWDGRVVVCDQGQMAIVCWTTGGPGEPAMVPAVYFRVVREGRYWVTPEGLYEFAYYNRIPWQWRYERL